MILINVIQLHLELQVTHIKILIEPSSFKYEKIT